MAGGNDLLYDTTGDGVVDFVDLEDWILNLKQTLIGDANLDFVVDVADFNRWNSNKFTFHSSWSNGDFNADGVIDVGDFNLWNGNKFTSALGLGSSWRHSEATDTPTAVAVGLGRTAPRDAMLEATEQDRDWPSLIERVFAEEWVKE